MTNAHNLPMKITLTKTVARHVDSGRLKINGERKIDYDTEDAILYGDNNIDDIDIIYERDERYNENDTTQEHKEDYDTLELSHTIDIEDGEYQEYAKEYEEYKYNTITNRKEYYGYCMNLGGGTKKYKSMYGDDSIVTLEQYIFEKKFL